MHSNFPGKNLALDWLVHSNASSMRALLCDQHPFPGCLQYVTLLVDSHLCRVAKGAMFPKRPREHRFGAFLLSLCVILSGELLEDGSFSQKDKIYFT
jgi:hypothetical protein